MRSHIISTLAGFIVLLLIQPCSAAYPVVDIGLIKTNLATARRDLVEQLLQGKRQIEQIQQMAAQIRQIDDYLDRFGDPKKVTIGVFNEVIGFLRDIELGKTSSEVLRDLDAGEVFKTKADSPYAPVSSDIVIEGRTVAQRDAEPFAPEVAARRTFGHYRDVQASVLKRRPAIKAEMNTALSQLRTASTSSEVQKLDIIIRSLEAQLAATDREMQFAANEAMTRYLENQVEERVQAKAAVQQKRAALKASSQEEIGMFPLPVKPVFFER